MKVDWRSWFDPQPLDMRHIWALRIVLLFVTLTALLRLFGVLPL